MGDYFFYLLNVYILNFVTNFKYFFICTVLLYVIVKTAKYTGLIDIPNSRSSHVRPTPSGGGLAIASIILIANHNAFKTCPEFFIGGLFISVIGLMDDIKSMPVLPRLLTQFLVVSLIIYFLPAQNPVKGIPVTIVKILLIFSGVWFINLYNFMDGIDGLAGGYANAASVGFLFCITSGLRVEEWNFQIYTQIIYITIPFLIFNWSPAKIFLGDIGSTFLGFTFFSLGARGLLYGNYIMYAFIIIMSFFWIDATITLARRFFLGKRVFSAHKEHAFQKAAAKYGHWRVSAFIIAVTLFWLNPMANLTVKHGQYGPILTTLTILPVLIIVLSFKPGLPVEKEVTKDSFPLEPGQSR
ncbi:MAG: glycosyltransferase family 4 protein [Deltaproteobacteria bacterium]|jgi:Fuc2NAc and GlcNAc transferase|nr:glycosyltransferase family 4 protein [Deltaproteobacteria bacterium]